MKKIFEDQRAVRQLVLKTVENLDAETMNKIPEGFNNNIIWNFAHILVTQQLLSYSLSGLTPNIPKEWIKKYRIGTKPESVVSEEEIAEIKASYISLIDKTEEDINAGIFKEFTPYTTSYNVALNTLQDALYFNNSHEALHLGYILALCRTV